MFFYKKKKVLINILMICFCICFITGCSMKFFSKGWGNYKNAQKAWEKGNYSAALYYASESVKLDYKLLEPKVFLKDYHDQAIKKINHQLTRLSKRTVHGAEERVEIYVNLDKYYTNLKNISLPLTDEKEGWTWNPTIKDYSKKVLNAKKNAYRVLLGKSNSLIKNMQLEQAEKLYQRAISKYLTDYSKAQIARNKMKSVFTKAYYKRGIKKESNKNLNSYIDAVSDYEKSYGWDNTNINSKNKIKSVKNKIASIYYNKAQSLERTNKNEAVNFYVKCLEWVSGYKDAAKRIKDLLISQELVKLEKNIAKTQQQLSMLQSEPAKLTHDLTTAADALNKITYISDTLRRANKEMKEITHTLTVFRPIPTVNVVTRTTEKIVNDARRPVGLMVRKFDHVEKPIINPVKNSIDNLKRVNNAVVSKVAKISKTTDMAKKLVHETNTCIANQQDPKILMNIGREIKETNKAFEKINRSLGTTNKTLKTIRPSIKKIANLQPVANRVSKSASRITRPIHEIKKATHEVDKVINESITLRTPIRKKEITLSIKAILTGAIPKPAKIILNKFTSAALRILDPVFRRLKERIPSIKGLNEIKRGIEDIKHVSSRIKIKTETIKKSIRDLESENRLIQRKLSTIKSTACSRW